MTILGSRFRERHHIFSLQWLVCAVLVMLVVSLAGSAFAQEDNAPEALVDRNTIAVGESLFLRVMVHGGDADIDTSVITNFEVVSRGTSTQIEAGMSGIERTTTYSYTLIPQKSGELQIPALPVKTDDGTQYTKPITITVTPDTESSDKDIFLRATVSNATPWVGEQVVYTLTVFLGLPISNAQLGEPEFSKADVVRLDGQTESEEIHNGRQYKTATFRFMVTPLEAGEIAVKPVTLRADMLVPTRNRNLPGRGFGQGFAGMDRFFSFSDLQPVAFRSNPVSLTAKALPPVPFGTTFSGLVGDFTLDVATDVTSARGGDSVTMTVTLSGRGNVASASLPAIVWPEGMKVYDDAPERDVNTDEKGYYGKKTFRLALVPAKPGTFVIPSVHITYFDPVVGKYKTLESEPISLTVTGQAVIASPVPSIDSSEKIVQSQTPATEPVIQLQQTPIRPLRRGPVVLTDEMSFGPLLFGVIALGSTALYVLFLLVRRFAARQTRRIQQAKRRVVNHARRALLADTDEAMLEAAGRALESVRQFSSNNSALERHIEKLNTMRFRPIPPGHEEIRTATEEALRIVEAICR
ncbi:BatD family protein [Desulfovibrio inopinatus]|uniref:BatD family protein n=1 Tax=Desulfovibrio inopinatus TaxID=102109 RepID=UPI000487E572|nr:BatD family protein [Desulfovibrio inopinatus]